MTKQLKQSSIDINRILELFICVFYTWYFLPVCNALFWTPMYKILFFGCFAVGIAGMMFFNKIRLNAVVVIVAMYMLYMASLYFLRIDDADAHIRISFTFWGTALLYFGVLNDDSRIRIGKFLFLLFIITAITSAIGVVKDNSAARTIAHASIDDSIQRQLKLRNIASLGLYQGMVYFVPLLVFMPKTPKQKIAAVVMLLSILAILINASFTIALIVYVVALFLSLILKTKGVNRVVTFPLIAIAIIVAIINGEQILSYLASIIDNSKISVRILEMRDMLYYNTYSGDAGLRWELYEVSYKTFLSNPLGVGAYYSYNKFENGIGYHSQLLDDLARFGLLAVGFYVVFFSGYYRQLKNSWKQNGAPQIAIVVCIVYILLLILNLGFRTAEESVIILYLMPVIPLMIKQSKSMPDKAGELS